MTVTEKEPHKEAHIISYNSRSLEKNGSKETWRRASRGPFRDGWLDEKKSKSNNESQIVVVRKEKKKRGRETASLRNGGK